MEISPKQRKVNVLWARGFNPIHLFGDFYLVRKYPTNVTKWSMYIIKIIKN